MASTTDRAAWQHALDDIIEIAGRAEKSDGPTLVLALHEVCTQAPLEFAHHMQALPPVVLLHCLCDAGAADQAAIDLVNSVFGIMLSQPFMGQVVATVVADLPFDEYTSEGASIAIALVGAAAGALHEAISVGQSRMGRQNLIN